MMNRKIKTRDVRNTMLLSDPLRDGLNLIHPYGRCVAAMSRLLLSGGSLRTLRGYVAETLSLTLIKGKWAKPAIAAEHKKSLFRPLKSELSQPGRLRLFVAPLGAPASPSLPSNPT